MFNIKINGNYNILHQSFFSLTHFLIYLSTFCFRYPLLPLTQTHFYLPKLIKILQKKFNLSIIMNQTKNTSTLELFNNEASIPIYTLPTQNSDPPQNFQNQQISNEVPTIIFQMNVMPNENDALISTQNEEIHNVRQIQEQKSAKDNLIVMKEQCEVKLQKPVEFLAQTTKSHDLQEKNKLIKCQNKICNSNQNIKKIKSKVQDKYLNLCKRCCESYANNDFCYYCDQIYLSSFNQNGLEWVQCEDCQRWTHIKCQKQNNNSKSTQKLNISLCIDCLKKNKRNRNPNDSYQLYEYEKSKKKINPKNLKISPASSTQKIKLFREKKQMYILLDSFLTGFGYKLSLNDDQINRDLQRIRDSSEIQNTNRSVNSYNKNSSRKKKP